MKYTSLPKADIIKWSKQNSHFTVSTQDEN